MIAALVGCRKDGGTGRARLSTTKGGRTVTAFVPSPASIGGESGAILVFSGNHVVRVELNRVTLDGIELMPLPAGTKKFDVTIDDSGLLTASPEGAAPVTRQL